MLEPSGKTLRSTVRAAMCDGIRRLDAPLRRVHGVFEFSRSDECLLRIAVERAERPIRYPDGVVVARGERVITLHFWNEHLPTMPDEGPTMVWANRFRRQLNQSLRELALCVRTDPRLAGARGVRACLASATPGHRQTVKRFGAHFGLQVLDGGRSVGLSRRLSGLIDNLWQWVLAWAFNPPALRNRDITKVREEIGMSSAALIARFAPPLADGARITLADAPAARAPAGAQALAGSSADPRLRAMGGRVTVRIGSRREARPRTAPAAPRPRSGRRDPVRSNERGSPCAFPPSGAMGGKFPLDRCSPPPAG